MLGNNFLIRQLVLKSTTSHKANLVWRIHVSASYIRIVKISSERPDLEPEKKFQPFI